MLETQSFMQDVDPPLCDKLEVASIWQVSPKAQQ
jgi:hypothetical protein